MTSQWSSFANYRVGDQVQNGSAVVYQCILANTNQPPPNATYWIVSPSTQLATFFIDTALPSELLIAGISTKVIDITPPFYQPNKHYLIVWTTLFNCAVAPTAGSLKFGLCQNTVPLTPPTINQQSSEEFNVATAFTIGIGGNEVLTSVSDVYLTDGTAPPKITLFYTGISISDNISVSVRQLAVILLD